MDNDDDSDYDNDDDDDDDDDTKLQQTRKRIRPPISSSSNNLRVSVFETNHVTNVKDLNDPRIKEKWTQLTKFNVLYDTVKYLKIEHCQQKSPEWTSKYKDFVNRILL